MFIRLYFFEVNRFNKYDIMYEEFRDKISRLCRHRKIYRDVLRKKYIKWSNIYKQLKKKQP